VESGGGNHVDKDAQFVSANSKWCHADRSHSVKKERHPHCAEGSNGQDILDGMTWRDAPERPDYDFLIELESASRARTASSSQYGGLRGIAPAELHEIVAADLSTDVVIIDARTRALNEMQHIRGATHVSMCEELPGRPLGEEAVLRAAKAVCSCVISQQRRKVDENSKIWRTSDVIIYDQAAPNPDAKYTRAVRLANAVLRSLASERVCVRVLEGGFGRFSALFPDDCDGAPEAFQQNDELQQHLRLRLGRTMYRRIVLKQLKCELSSAMPPPSEILPYLYIGCQRDATDEEKLGQLGITHVLVVGEELREHFADNGNRYTYKKLSVKDAVDEPLDLVFTEACEFLDGVRRQPGARVLVHCFAGRSRSVSVTIAYLIYLNYTFRAAFELIRERRIGISPNTGFMEILTRYEREQLGFSTRDEIQLDIDFCT